MPRKSVSEKPIVVSAGAAPAPVRRKSASTKRSARSADVTENPEVAAVLATAEPSQEEIGRLAYSYWEARGCVGGSSEEDWLRAERELRATR